MRAFAYVCTICLLISCIKKESDVGGRGFVPTTTTDPLYRYQWHLENTKQTSFSTSSGLLGFDINHASLLSKDINGSGVLIAISDSGIEIDHEDLAANYQTGISKNFQLAAPFDGDPVPDFDDDEDMHGTAVTGIIAAVAKNSIGGRGVAPSAKFGGFNILANGVTQDLTKILFQMTGPFDIFNYSYGTEQKFYLPFASDAERTAIINAYKTGVTSGRSGKGAIYVKSAGNDYAIDFSEYEVVWEDFILGNATFSENNNYPYTIITAAVNANGESSSYSSPGPNLWISAPGGEYGFDSPAIVTTDFSGCTKGSSKKESKINDFEKGVNTLNKNCNYTSTMNGTSSAAPNISGVVALMLQANPNLKWRDVKHILASKAAMVDFSTDNIKHPLGTSYDLTGHVYQQGWKKNAANFWFHNYFGFGMVDAEASVEMAKTYNLDLGEFKDTLNLNDGNWLYSSGNLNSAIPNNSATGTQNNILVKHNFIVEAVQIKVNVLHDYVSNLGIELTSPSGTKSIITNINSNVLNENLTDTILLSNAFYGEKSSGNWTLKVIDGANKNPDGSSGTSGTLVNWSINVYGHVNPDRSDITAPLEVPSITIPATFNSLTSTPAITWGNSSSTDLMRYEYCIGTTSGECDIYSWTSNGNSTTLNLSGLSLSDGLNYYISVRVVDSSENTSEVESATWLVDL